MNRNLFKKIYLFWKIFYFFFCFLILYNFAVFRSCTIIQILANNNFLIFHCFTILSFYYWWKPSQIYVTKITEGFSYNFRNMVCDNLHISLLITEFSRYWIFPITKSISGLSILFIDFFGMLIRKEFTSVFWSQNFLTNTLFN
jgi:hypothetical protein